MTDNADTPSQQRRTEAVTKRSHWPGWIWAVPAAAVAIAGWLLVRQIGSGIEVSVTFDDAAGMKANNTVVLYRGVEVGQVTGLALASDGSHVIARLTIDETMEKNLNSGTQFYLQGVHPSLSNPASLKAVFAGPTIIMRPGTGKPAREFTGVAGSPPQALGMAVPYLVEFDGAVGGLETGAPVTFRGFTVGDVVSARLAVDSRTGKVSTPVVLMLDPARFHIQEAGEAPDWPALMNATLAKLVHRGLRARLTRTPPLIGTRQVVLEVVADAPEAQLATGGRYPEIPAAAPSGFGSFVTELEGLPLADVVANVRAVSKRLRALVSSPQLEESLARLDDVLAQLDEVMQKAGPQVAPTISSLHETVESLRKTARAIDAAAEAAGKITGTTPLAPEGNLQRTLNELTQAARAVRALADYLDQHPEALIGGR